MFHDIIDIWSRPGHQIVGCAPAPVPLSPAGASDLGASSVPFRGNRLVCESRPGNPPLRESPNLHGLVSAGLCRSPLPDGCALSVAWLHGAIIVVNDEAMTFVISTFPLLFQSI